jgi:hypothetical protein
MSMTGRIVGMILKCEGFKIMHAVCALKGSMSISNGARNACMILTRRDCRLSGAGRRPFVFRARSQSQSLSRNTT